MTTPVPARQLVLSTRLLYPDWSMAQIGDSIGISRQRVHQILVSENLPTRRKSKYVCNQCGKRVRYINKMRLCSNCLYSTQHIAVTCNWCGKGKIVNVCYYRHSQKPPYKGHFYCNRMCFRKRLGTKHEQTTSLNERVSKLERQLIEVGITPEV